MSIIKALTIKTVVLIVITSLSIQCNKKTDNSTQYNAVNRNLNNNNIKQTQILMAYVDAEFLLTHFNYYRNLISSYENKVNEQNIFLNSSYQKLQNEITNFQQKIQNNAFPTQEKMKQEQTRIQNLEKNFKKKTAKLEKIWTLKQKQIEKDLSDSLSLGIKEFNTPQKYQFIFMNTGNTNILYGDKECNITDPVIKFLNKRFPTSVLR